MSEDLDAPDDASDAVKGGPGYTLDQPSGSTTPAPYNGGGRTSSPYYGGRG